MARLPDHWIAHLGMGPTLRVGSTTAEGQPELAFAQAGWMLPDGRMELLIARRQGTHLLAAIAATGRIAVSAGLPSNNHVLHLKGSDAEVLAPRDEHGPMFADYFETWLRQIEAFGADRRKVHATLGDLSLPHLDCVRFTPLAAWDQTPGPGAGQPIDFLP